jgi:hypothetical protein
MPKLLWWPLLREPLAFFAHALDPRFDLSFRFENELRQK